MWHVSVFMIMEGFLMLPETSLKDLLAAHFVACPARAAYVAHRERRINCCELLLTLVPYFAGKDFSSRRWRHRFQLRLAVPLCHRNSKPSFPFSVARQAPQSSCCRAPRRPEPVSSLAPWSPGPLVALVEEEYPIQTLQAVRQQIPGSCIANASRGSLCYLQVAHASDLQYAP